MAPAAASNFSGLEHSDNNAKYDIKKLKINKRNFKQTNKQKNNKPRPDAETDGDILHELETNESTRPSHSRRRRRAYSPAEEMFRTTPEAFRNTVDPIDKFVDVVESVMVVVVDYYDPT
ncbi:hypothetical protein DERF_011233 [Dermatophagoides farinae]|uniref:Uncharacterized protein n=1 Tax=Dermatophagoides farinae TaxID=6954 RepID=A0A922HSM2_DERFA|nr:hypothetical protein DERF_011233 [Dermatophagoides farinae]